MKVTSKNRNFLLLFFIILAIILYLLQQINVPGTTNKIWSKLPVPSVPNNQKPDSPNQVKGKDNPDAQLLEMLKSIAVALLKHSGFEGKVSMPELSIEEGMGTYYEPAKGKKPAKINVDLTTIRTARKLSKSFQDLLAWSVGHELAHHILHHAEASSFLKYYLNGNNPKNTNETHKQKLEEDQADKLGALMALLAGYSVNDKAAEYIEQLYIAYGLEEKQEQDGYPSLHIRKKASKEAINWAKDGYHKITAANYALCLEEYALAAQLYEGVQEVYCGPEVLKNHSIALAKVALQIGTPYRLQPYVFAFEPEWGGRMIGLGKEMGARNSLEETRQQQERLINMAKNQIRYALRIDSSINMQIHDLMVQAVVLPQRATVGKAIEEKLQKILSKARGKNEELAKFTQGLWLAINGDTSLALQIWDKLYTRDQQLQAAILFNKKVLKGESILEDTMVRLPLVMNTIQIIKFTSYELADGSIQYKIDGSNDTSWVMNRKFLPVHTAIPSGGKKFHIPDGTLHVFTAQKLIYKKNRDASVEKIHLHNL